MQMPRRAVVSGNYDLPEFPSHLVGKGWITVNGVEIAKAHAWDADAGWVSYYVTDEAGCTLLNDAQDAPLSRVVKGVVQVGLR